MVYSLVIGAIAGWLAGNFIKGQSLGLLWNIVLGIVGGVVGNWLLHKVGLGFGSGIIGDIITGSIGASVLLFIASRFK